MVAKTTLRLLVGMFFLCCLLPASVSGQAAWSYTDTWMDEDTGYDETGENSELFVVGCGVAEVDTSALAHSVNMTVGVISPQGRQNYGAGYWTQQSSGTSMTVVVPLNVAWEPADTGNYLTETSVQATCPYDPFVTYGSASIPIGISFIAMQLVLQPPTPAGYLYEKVQPCDVYCNVPQTNRTAGPPVGCIQLQIPYGPLGCSAIVRVVKYAQACICFDISYN